MTNKTILITGGSRGIGLEIAKSFLGNPETENIILIARDSDIFVKTQKHLIELSKGTGTELEFYTADVANRTEIKNIVTGVMKKYGNIDVLVNNAGYTNPVPIHQVEFADFERTIAVNLYAPFTFIQEALHLGNKFNFIVNIASTAGINGRSGWLTYSASKAALINMSQVLREELAIFGTRVVSVSPGRTATDLRKILAPDEDPDTIMQPEHVAQVIKLLVSPTGKFVDSENLVVRL